MKKALKNIKDLPGVEHVVIACNDGLVFDALGSASLNAEMLAAEVTSMTLALRQSLAFLNSKELYRYQFATEQYEVTAICLDRLVLFATARPGTQLRTIHIELAKAANRLSQMEAQPWT